MDIADWVFRARTAANLTQEELGAHLGVTKGNVSAWEKGRHEPSYRQMARIAQLTNFALPMPPTGYAEPSSIGPVHLADETDERAQAYRADAVLAGLGDILQALPPARRGAFADALSGWARDGGADHWRLMLLALITTPPEKQRLAG